MKTRTQSFLTLFAIFQLEFEALQRKYHQAKRVIARLKKHDYFQSVELQKQNRELVDRVIQLEKELVNTQKNAGMPVRLPYEDTLLNGSQELASQRPVMQNMTHKI